MLPDFHHPFSWMCLQRSENQKNIKYQTIFPAKKFGIIWDHGRIFWVFIILDLLARLRPKKMPISSTQQIRDHQPTNTNHQKISYIHLNFMWKYKLLIKYICSIYIYMLFIFIYYVTSLSVTSHVRWLKLKDVKNPIIDWEK